MLTHIKIRLGRIKGLKGLFYEQSGMKNKAEFIFARIFG